MKTSPRSKLRQTIPGFVILILSLIIVYFIARWVCATVFNRPVKNGVWEIYIPVLLPILPSMYFVYSKLSSFGIEVPWRSKLSLTVFSLATATGMLMTLNNFNKESKEMLVSIPDISKIDTLNSIKYFKIKQYSVNKYGGHISRYIREKGRRGDQKLTLHLYIALPLLKYPDEPIEKFPMIWYGLKFSMGVNASRSEESKRALEKEFLKESLQKIEAMTFNNESYFELISPSEDKEWYVNAINSIPISHPQYPYQILKPYYNSFNQKARNSLYWCIGILLFGTLAFSLEVYYRTGLSQSEI